MQQLVFDLPEIDRKATREALENVFQAYRDYRTILRGMGIEPPTTAKYEEVGGRAEGKVSDPTGTAVTREEQMTEFISKRQIPHTWSSNQPHAMILSYTT